MSEEIKDEVHIVPVDDIIEHETHPDCICEPECEPVQREDGSFGYVYLHKAKDGRK